MSNLVLYQDSVPLKNGTLSFVLSKSKTFAKARYKLCFLYNGEVVIQLKIYIDLSIALYFKLSTIENREGVDL